MVLVSAAQLQACFAAKLAPEVICIMALYADRDHRFQATFTPAIAQCLEDMCGSRWADHVALATVVQALAVPHPDILMHTPRRLHDLFSRHFAAFPFESMADWDPDEAFLTVQMSQLSRTELWHHIRSWQQYNRSALTVLHWCTSLDAPERRRYHHFTLPALGHAAGTALWKAAARLR